MLPFVTEFLIRPLEILFELKINFAAVDGKHKIRLSSQFLPLSIWTIHREIIFI